MENADGADTAIEQTHNKSGLTRFIVSPLLLFLCLPKQEDLQDNG